MRFTFSEIVETLNERLSNLNGFKRVLFYSVYQRLIDLIAYITTRLNYVAEYFYVESSWKNARNRSSLINQSYYLSYRPHRKIGARGGIEISGDPNFNPSYIYPGQSVFIPRWTQLENDDGQSVYTLEDITYFRNQAGSITVPVKEGVPREFVYTADGSRNETITIFSDSTDSEELQVFIVDANLNILETVNIIEDPFFINELDGYYCTVEDESDFSSVRIIFGDGIYTRRLLPGQIVLIKYADTLGDDGNIDGRESINSFVEPVLDIVGNQVELFTRNPSPISDGSNYESLRSIRSNGRRLFFAGFRASSREDWLTIINSYPNVLKSTIWTRMDLGLPAIGFQQNIINVSIVSKTGDALTNEQQQDLAFNLLLPSKSPTDVVSFQALNKIFVKYDVIATVPNGIPRNQIEGEINTTLDSNFSVIQLDFNEDIYESNYTSVIDRLPNILFHTTTANYVEDTDLRTIPGIARRFRFNTGQPYALKISNPNETNPENRIRLSEKTFEVWIRRKIAGVWYNPTRMARDTGNPLSVVRGIKYISTKGFIEKSVAPTVNDDETQNYAKDSIWREEFSVNNFRWYVCTDATTGSAVWQNLNLTSEGVPTSLTDSNITGLNEGSMVYIEASGRYYECIDDSPAGAIWQQRFNIRGFGDGSDSMLSYTWEVDSPGTLNYEDAIVTYNIQNIANDPLSNGQWGFLDPTDSVQQATGYLIYLMYRTEDGNGQQRRDIRLSEFQQILDFDPIFNTFDIRYRN